MMKTLAISSRMIILLKSDASLSLSGIVRTWIMPRIPKAIEAPINTRVAIFCISLYYQNRLELIQYISLKETPRSSKWGNTLILVVLEMDEAVFESSGVC